MKNNLKSIAIYIKILSNNNLMDKVENIIKHEY